MDYRSDADAAVLGFQIGGIVSLVASALVIVSAVSFETWQTLKNKRFIQLIILVSACDFLGSLGSAVGFQLNQSPLCYFQSVLTTYFWNASWLWITIFTLEMYHVIAFKKPLVVSHWRYHVFVWTFSAAVLLLPLSTNTLGSTDDNSTAWCFIGGDEHTAFIWFVVTQILVLFGCVAVMMTIWALLAYKYSYPSRQSNSSTTGNNNVNASNSDVNSVMRPLVASAIDAIKLYPLSLIIVWMPNVVTEAVLSNTSTNNPRYDLTGLIYIISAILATQNGTALALIYFSRSKEGRSRIVAISRAIGAAILKPCGCLPLLPSGNRQLDQSLLNVLGGTGASGSASVSNWAVMNRNSSVAANRNLLEDTAASEIEHMHSVDASQQQQPHSNGLPFSHSIGTASQSFAIGNEAVGPHRPSLGDPPI